MLPDPRVKLLVPLLAASFVACGGNLRDQKTEPSAPRPTDAEWERLRSLRWSDEVPPDVTNAFADDPAVARFGQQLFFYPGFSGPLLESDNDGGPESLGVRGETGRVSCAGCHLPLDGFVDTRSRGKQLSLASRWTERRTPSLLGVGHRKLLTWIGKSDTLFGQVFTVLENEREMNTSRLFVAQEVFRTFRTEYEALFGPLPPLDDTERFPELTPELAGCDPHAPREPAVCRGRPGDGGVYDGMSAEDQDAVTRVVVNVGKALGAYQRLLDCGAGRFDAWLDGDEKALSASEQRGALLFVGKAQCVDCHGGPQLSDFGFHNVGLEPGVVAVAFRERDAPGAYAGLAEALESPLNSRGPYSDGDDDRLPEEIPEDLLGAHATPSLRCVSLRPTFMHTGQISSLEGVVDFFDRGGNHMGYLGRKEIEPLGLTERERADLVAFLRALDGPGPSSELLHPPH